MSDYGNQVRTTTFRGKDNVPLKEVANELNLSYQRVWTRVCIGRETGDDIEANYRQPKPATKKPGDRSAKVKIYEVGGFSGTASELADIADVSLMTFHRRMRKYGTPFIERSFVTRNEETGITLNAIKQLAEEHGIKEDTLKNRLRAGETLEEAIGDYRPKISMRNPVEINGVTKPRSQWMKENGVSRSLLSVRLRRGWPVEIAVTTPPRGLDYSGIHAVIEKERRELDAVSSESKQEDNGYE